jgi:peptide deformylase
MATPFPFRELLEILHVITYAGKLFSGISMALLPILRFPDPRLKKVAAPVMRFDDDLRRLAADMAETMYEAPGIGLAATQVDVHMRLVVIDVSEDKGDLRVFVNPRLVACAGSHTGEEGCLSVPGIFDKVERAERVTVNYQDLDGSEQVLEADGLLAVCIQHEIDHLDGKVFVDHLSQLKQTRIRSKLAKQARVTA